MLSNNIRNGNSGSRLPYNLYCVGGDVQHCSFHATVGVDGSSLQADSQQRLLAWSEGWRPLGAQSAFIDCTLAMA